MIREPSESKAPLDAASLAIEPFCRWQKKQSTLPTTSRPAKSVSRSTITSTRRSTLDRLIEQAHQPVELRDLHVDQVGGERAKAGCESLSLLNMCCNRFTDCDIRRDVAFGEVWQHFTTRRGLGWCEWIGWRSLDALHGDRLGAGQFQDGMRRYGRDMPPRGCRERNDSRLTNCAHQYKKVVLCEL